MRRSVAPHGASVSLSCASTCSETAPFQLVRRASWNGPLPEYLVPQRADSDQPLARSKPFIGTRSRSQARGNNTGAFVTHRVAAVPFLDFEIESRLWVLHRCDNPGCFNPEHLFFGAPLDNSRDAVANGRMRGKKLTEEQVAEIKRLLNPPGHEKLLRGVAAINRRAGCA